MDYSKTYKFKSSEIFAEKLILQFGFPDLISFDEFVEEYKIDVFNSNIKHNIEAQLHKFTTNEHKKIDDLFDEPNIKQFLLPYDVINIYFNKGNLNVNRLKNRYGINMHDICNELKSLHSTLIPEFRPKFIQGHYDSEKCYLDTMIKKIDYKLFGQPSVICTDLSLQYSQLYRTSVTKNTVDNASEILYKHFQHKNIFQHLSESKVIELYEQKIISNEHLLLCKNTSISMKLLDGVNWNKFSKLNNITTKILIKYLAFMKKVDVIRILTNPRNKINLSKLNPGYMLTLINKTMNLGYMFSDMFVNILQNQIIPRYIQSYICRYNRSHINEFIENVILTDETIKYLYIKCSSRKTNKIIKFQPFTLNRYNLLVSSNLCIELLQNITLTLSELKTLVNTTTMSGSYYSRQLKTILRYQKHGEEFIRNHCNGKLTNYLYENNIPRCEHYYDIEEYVNDGLFIKKYGIITIIHILDVISNSRDSVSYIAKFANLIYPLIKNQNDLKLSKCMALLTLLQDNSHINYFKYYDMLPHLTAYYDNIIINVDNCKYHNATTVTDIQVLLTMKYKNRGKKIKNIFHCKNVSNKVKYYYLINRIRSNLPVSGTSSLPTYICRYNKEIKKCVLDHIIRKTKSNKYSKLILSMI